MPDAPRRAHLAGHPRIPEILRAADRDARSTDSQSIFLHKVKLGTTGELAPTTFAETLPLIRYRTDDTVGVLSNGRYGCGFSSSIVRFL